MSKKSKKLKKAGYFQKTLVHHWIKQLGLTIEQEIYYEDKKIRVKIHGKDYYKYLILKEGEIPNYYRILGGFSNDNWYPQKFGSIKRAFEFLLEHEVYFKVEDSYFYINIWLDNNAKVNMGRFIQKKHNVDISCTLLREKDLPLALEVVKGNIGTEFIDYLQDHYGVEVL